MENSEKLKLMLHSAKKDKDLETIMQVYELNALLDLIPSSEIASALLPMVVFRDPEKTLKKALSGYIWGWSLESVGISGKAATYEISISFTPDSHLVNFEDFYEYNYGFGDLGKEWKKHVLSVLSSRKFLDPIKEAFRKHIAKEFPDLKFNFGIYPQGKLELYERMSDGEQPVKMYFQGHLSIR